MFVKRRGLPMKGQPVKDKDQIPATSFMTVVNTMFSFIIFI